MQAITQKIITMVSCFFGRVMQNDFLSQIKTNGSDVPVYSSPSNATTGLALLRSTKMVIFLIKVTYDGVAAWIKKYDSN